MSRFLQFHILTDYPISNPNRDDLGQPKSAMIGGTKRQRMSSQAIKRAIRDNTGFTAALKGHKGERTQRLGDQIANYLTDKGTDADRAKAIARDVAAAFGKIKGDKDNHPTRIEQLAFISPDERTLAFELADKALAGEALPKDKELAAKVLQHADGAVDIAMFGRMLADSPDYNRDAAVQVAHAFTTNAVTIESDFYTAVDDLNDGTDDLGAGFIGESGYGSGVYYLYVCVNRALLVKNLGNDAALAARGLEALAYALAQAVPGGKINSYANHARAKFILAEKGDRQPRSLASAFTRAVKPGKDDKDLTTASIKALDTERAGFKAAYGADWDDEKRLEVGHNDTATIDEIAAFAAAGIEDVLKGGEGA